MVIKIEVKQMLNMQHDYSHTLILTIHD